MRFMQDGKISFNLSQKSISATDLDDILSKLFPIKPREVVRYQIILQGPLSNEDAVANWHFKFLH